MEKSKKILWVIVSCISLNINIATAAANNLAQIETTPPAAEGVLTIDDIGPIVSKAAPVVPGAPAAPVSGPPPSLAPPENVGTPQQRVPSPAHE